MSSKKPELVKTLFVGDGYVGKTSLLVRYTDQRYEEYPTSSIGVDFKIKTFQHNEKEVKLQLWDPSGINRFRTLSKSYYKHAQGIFLCFDITNKESFESLESIIQEIGQLGKSDVMLVLVGTKCDLNDERKVSREEIDEFAQKHKLQFYETSAKTGTGVDGMFNAFFYQLIDELINTNQIFNEKEKEPESSCAMQ